MIVSCRHQSFLCLALLAMFWPGGAGWCGSPLESAGPSPRLRLLNAQAAQDSARLQSLLDSASRPGSSGAGHGAVGKAGNLCTVAIQSAERAEDLPPGLLDAIARVESGRADATGMIRPWPWTVNADGQGRYFADRDAAIAWTRLVLQHGAKAVDVGCMQVDLQQHPGAFASLEEAFMPAANARYAARFMRWLWAGSAGENWVVATGYYHSRNTAFSADYLTKVLALGPGLSLRAVRATGRD